MRDGLHGPEFVGINVKVGPEDGRLCKSYRLENHSRTGTKIDGVLAKDGGTNLGGGRGRSGVLDLGQIRSAWEG